MELKPRGSFFTGWRLVPDADAKTLAKQLASYQFSPYKKTHGGLVLGGGGMSPELRKRIEKAAREGSGAISDPELVRTLQEMMRKQRAEAARKQPEENQRRREEADKAKEEPAKEANDDG